MNNPNQRGRIWHRAPARHWIDRSITCERFAEVSQIQPMDWDEFCRANRVHPPKKRHVHRLSDF